MSEQEAVWFYTQHGERKGPVTLEVLRSAVTHMKVDRDKDLVWGPGLADWVKVTEVSDLQGVAIGPPPVTETSEQALAAPAEVKTGEPATPAATANPYKAPVAVDDEDNALADAMAERRNGGKSGRGIGRVLYIFLQIVFYALLVAGFFALIFVLMGSNGQVDAESLKAESTALFGVLALVLVYFVASLLTTFSRLTNLGMSRWNFLWSFVPFINIWLGFRLCACPAGYHNHRKLDTGGKIVLVLYIFMMILYVAAAGFQATTDYQNALEETQRKVDIQQSEEVSAPQNE